MKKNFKSYSDYVGKDWENVYDVEKYVNDKNQVGYILRGEHEKYTFFSCSDGLIDPRVGAMIGFTQEDYDPFVKFLDMCVEEDQQGVIFQINEKEQKVSYGIFLWDDEDWEHQRLTECKLEELIMSYRDSLLTKDHVTYQDLLKVSDEFDLWEVVMHPNKKSETGFVPILKNIQTKDILAPCKDGFIVLMDDMTGFDCGFKEDEFKPFNQLIDEAVKSNRPVDKILVVLILENKVYFSKFGDPESNNIPVYSMDMIKD